MLPSELGLQVGGELGGLGELRHDAGLLVRQFDSLRDLFARVFPCRHQVVLQLLNARAHTLHFLLAATLGFDTAQFTKQLFLLLN